MDDKDNENKRRRQEAVRNPSRDSFGQLASNEPARLAAWMLRGTLSRGHLSHAAEILGRETAGKESADGVVLVLERLLAHPSPAVREGAVYGLGYHRTPRVMRHLTRLADEDPSEGVREAIWEVFDDTTGASRDGPTMDAGLDEEPVEPDDHPLYCPCRSCESY